MLSSYIKYDDRMTELEYEFMEKPGTFESSSSFSENHFRIKAFHNFFMKSEAIQFYKRASQVSPIVTKSTVRTTKLML